MLFYYNCFRSQILSDIRIPCLYPQNLKHLWLQNAECLVRDKLGKVSPTAGTSCTMGSPQTPVPCKTPERPSNHQLLNEVFSRHKNYRIFVDNGLPLNDII